MVEIVAAELGTVFGGKVINVADVEGKLIIETETDYFALSDAEEKLMRVLRNTVQAYEGLLEMQRMNSGAEIKLLVDIVHAYTQKYGAQPAPTRDLYSTVNHDGTPARAEDGRRLFKSHEESRRLDAKEAKAKANAALKARAKKRAKK